MTVMLAVNPSLSKAKLNKWMHEELLRGFSACQEVEDCGVSYNMQGENKSYDTHLERFSVNQGIEDTLSIVHLVILLKNLPLQGNGPRLALIGSPLPSKPLHSVLPVSIAPIYPVHGWTIL